MSKKNNIILISLIFQALAILCSFLPFIYKHMIWDIIAHGYAARPFEHEINFYCGSYSYLPDGIGILCYATLTFMIINLLITYFHYFKNSFYPNIFLQLIPILPLTLIIGVTIIGEFGKWDYEYSKMGEIEIDWLFYVLLGCQIVVCVLNVTNIIQTQQKNTQ